MSESIISTETDSVSEADAAGEGDHLGVVDLLLSLVRHKKLILGLPLIAGILSALYTYTLPIMYTGTVKLLPPQQAGGGAAALLSQLGGALGGATGAARGSNDLYVGMLKSRTVADQMIERFDLDKYYGHAIKTDTRIDLAGHTEILPGRDGIMVINVEDKDPKMAANMANAYAEELLNLTKVLAVTEAARRRLFFEQQLEKTKNAMTAAEVSARQGLESGGGLAKADDQGRAIVSITSRLRGQISIKEVQIASMRAYAAEQNPELLRAQEELQALKRELARFEDSNSSQGQGALGKQNNGALENLARLREVKYQETLYELFARQFEAAKLDEARDSAVVQVMDNAIEPDKKSKPSRRLIVMVTMLAALVIAILGALFLEAMARTRADPRKAARLAEIRQLLAQWR